ncbi:L,D-transpeptidase [Pseudoclavibacter sp. 13-3]|uniref:L,D-transpeptidase n=1 Tax=Pseudoclavibacter sp. 13-3 TaxID=2901228 RepID=UPI001E5BDE6E|nr:L,D-transpeptidase [Pseudoclavibacter sp. 13-3]MCD7100808.1 L,D-transpeptidase family protein [Pseudoclavibacter sp. 13-3]
MGDNVTLDRGTGAEATPTAEPTTELIDVTAAGGMPPTGGLDDRTGAPVPPDRHRRRKAPFILGGLGVLVLAAIGFGAWYSADHVAPGVTYAGADLGGQTAEQAAQIIQRQFDQHTVPFSFDGTQQQVEAADLGLQIDAQQTAHDVIADQPAWQFWRWNSASTVVPQASADAAAESSFFSEAWPAAYTVAEPSLEYQAAKASFTVSPGHAGQGVDTAAVEAAFLSSFVRADSSTQQVTQTAAQPTITDEQAHSALPTAQQLVRKITFQVGGKSLMTADAATVGSWVKVSDRDGQFSAVYDANAISDFIAQNAPAKLDPTPKTQTVLASDTSVVLVPGSTGKTLGDVASFAEDVAAKAGAGESSFDLPVTEVPFETKTLDRKIDISLAARSASLIENGQVITTFPMSPGLQTNSGAMQAAKTSTKVGEYKVWYKTTVQSMGCTPQYDYCTPNVKWSTFFNGDQALHGTYWHNQFGISDMSHGCVNLREADAKTVYDFAPIGTPVSVHY